MDNKKIFIILIIVLALNFVIGSTGVVLAAVSLARQSGIAVNGSVAKRITTGPN